MWPQVLHTELILYVADIADKAAVLAQYVFRIPLPELALSESGQTKYMYVQGARQLTWLLG